MRRIVAFGVLLGLAGTGGATVASAAVTDEPVPPGDLIVWLADDGPLAALSAPGGPAAEASEVTIGAPSAVYVWTDGFLGAGVSDPAAEPSGVWAAPVEVGGERVGVLLAAASDTPPESRGTVWDATLADAMNTPGAQLIHDNVVKAWFLLRDARVSPADETAREMLAGSLGIDDAREFVRSWHSPADSSEPPENDEIMGRLSPVMLTAGALFAILAAAGFLVWLRRGEEERVKKHDVTKP